MKLRFEHPLWRRWAPVILRKLVQGYLRSCPTEEVISPEALGLMLAGEPVVYAVWHCHLLFPMNHARHYYENLPPLATMASPSRDGEFIGEVARGMGWVICPGSRRKGGVQALQAMAEYCRRGHSAAIVADGSRGPARVAQKGVLFLAREARVPIIPVAVAARWKKVFNTWDRFELPLPFSRIAFMAGAPLWVPPESRGAALESLRRELEARLNDLYHQSRGYFASAKKISRNP